MLDSETQDKITKILTSAIYRKINSYKAETEYKPFIEAFFNREEVITHSVVHAFYTSFGMSAYEQIAILLAKAAGFHAEHQYTLRGQIDDNTALLITRICESSSKGKEQEIEIIRNSIQSGPADDYYNGTVDVFVKKPDGTEIYVDITTVKPNLKDFRTLRDKMLRWAALRFSQKQDAKVHTHIGIPYNPYHPEPYTRWTSGGNDANEILVQERLWSTFAGYDVYPDLIRVFEHAGEQVREDVSEFLRNQY